MHSLPLIAQLTRKARHAGLKSRLFQSRRARTSFFVFFGEGGVLPLPARRAPARARRRGCCSTRAMAPHGRAARRVAGPVTERRRNPVNVRVCNVGGLRWPLIAFASYQPTDCRPLATYRRHSLAVAVLHSTPPHPTCLSHPSLSALGLIQSIPHSSGATGVPGEASRGSLYESVCQVTIYVHRTASGQIYWRMASRHCRIGCTGARRCFSGGAGRFSGPQGAP